MRLAFLSGHARIVARATRATPHYNNDWARNVEGANELGSGVMAIEFNKANE